MKANFKYVLLFLLVCAILIMVEIIKPEAINWSLSFSRKAKIPYGSYIIYKLLPSIFPGHTVSEMRMPIYNCLKNKNLLNTNYIFITDIFKPDKLDTEQLLQFAANGNQVFIAAQHFAGIFADTLNLKTSSKFTFRDSIQINFVNPKLRKIGYYNFRLAEIQRYFSSFDSTQTTILGIDNKERINFLKLKFGEGCFYFHSIPTVFSNYNILKENNADYIARAFCYLPIQNTLWDECYKAGRSIVQSPLRYILKNQSLKKAYWLMIISIFLFIFFEGKRKQRIIPVIKPLRNTSLEFVQTVGSLYYQHSDHKNLAQKKIMYFLEYIRTNFYLETNLITEKFYQTLGEKSGIPAENIKKLFFIINQINSKSEISAQELMTLNGYVENFYQTNKG